MCTNNFNLVSLKLIKMIFVVIFFDKTSLAMEYNACHKPSTYFILFYYVFCDFIFLSVYIAGYYLFARTEEKV